MLFYVILLFYSKHTISHFGHNIGNSVMEWTRVKIGERKGLQYQRQISKALNVWKGCEGYFPKGSEAMGKSVCRELVFYRTYSNITSLHLEACKTGLNSQEKKYQIFSTKEWCIFLFLYPCTVKSLFRMLT